MNEKNMMRQQPKPCLDQCCDPVQCYKHWIKFIEILDHCHDPLGVIMIGGNCDADQTKDTRCDQRLNFFQTNGPAERIAILVKELQYSNKKYPMLVTVDGS